MGIPHILPIYWEDDQLLLLDQRELPTRKEYLRIHGSEEVREAILHLAVRGAPAIGIAAAYGVYLGIRELKDDVTFWEVLSHVSSRLTTARPTAINLAWAVKRVVERVTRAKEEPLEKRKQAALDEAKAIHEEDISFCRKIGENALSLLQDGTGVLTHCNAGGLATSAYGTALSPFYLAKERG